MARFMNDPPRTRLEPFGTNTMDESFRLSRLKAPRGTALAIVLLALVFLLFGFTVNAVASDRLAAQPPTPLDGTLAQLAEWLPVARS